MSDTDTDVETTASESDGDVIDATTESFELTASQIEDLGARFAIMGALGQQYDGGRDLYDTFGWIRDPDIDDFYAHYLRNPYARAVVDVPVETTWRGSPEIVDRADTEADEQTGFEEDVEELVDELRLWHYAMRADKLAGIGEYGLLIVGYDDGADDFSVPVQQSALSPQNPADNINWLRPLSQKSVKKIKLGDPGSGQWGYPVYYKINLADENDNESVGLDQEVWVHASRVVHIAEDLLDDEVRGTPRQEPVLNSLTDIEKTLGAAAETAYRAADYGLHANVDPEYSLSDGGDALDEELFKFVHDLQPLIRTEGVDIETLGGTDIDPSPVISSEIEAISAQTGMPQSILKGNETGERATTQDLKDWYGQMSERRDQHATPNIVRGLFDDFIKYGVVRPPNGGENAYDAEWEPFEEESAKDISEVAVDRATVLKHIKALVPSIDSAGVVQYIEDGEFPEIESEEVVTEIDESDPQVQRFMEQAFGPQDEAQNGQGEQGQEQPAEAD